MMNGKQTYAFSTPSRGSLTPISTRRVVVLYIPAAAAFQILIVWSLTAETCRKEDYRVVSLKLNFLAHSLLGYIDVKVDVAKNKTSFELWS
jgi:hypothetical protein